MHSFMLQCATTNVISLIIVTLLDFVYPSSSRLSLFYHHYNHFYDTFQGIDIIGQPQTCHLQPVTVVLDTQMGIRCYYYFALFVELYHYMRKCMMLINL